MKALLVDTFRVIGYLQRRLLGTYGMEFSAPGGRAKINGNVLLVGVSVAMGFCCCQVPELAGAGSALLERGR
jgi:hypothetical protein